MRAINRNSHLIFSKKDKFKPSENGSQTYTKQFSNLFENDENNLSVEIEEWRLFNNVYRILYGFMPVLFNE